MEESSKRQRKSLRDSVLKRPENPGFQDNIFQEHGHTRKENDFPQEGGHVFSGFGRIFDNDDAFPSFGFGRMNPFGGEFNEMMERFFADFNPESFSDSPFHQQDTDLDEDISRRGLDRALERRTSPDQPQAFMQGFSHSESIIKKQDGTIERKVTHRDSQGNVETTVTIMHPDGSTEILGDGDSTPRSILPPPDGASDFEIPEYKGMFRRIYENIRSFFPD